MYNSQIMGEMINDQYLYCYIIYTLFILLPLYWSAFLLPTSSKTPKAFQIDLQDK